MTCANGTPMAARFPDNARVLNGLDKFLLFVALPAVVLASLIEAIVLARLRSYDWRASAVSRVNRAGSCDPSATRAAPVSVAMSISSSGLLSAP